MIAVTLKITNTKTGSVTTKVWNLTLWTFGEQHIDVSDILLKIRTIYNTRTFAFTLTDETFKGRWLHFDGELIGTHLVGRGLTVKFI